MKLIKEAKKLTVEQAKWHLEYFKEIYSYAKNCKQPYVDCKCCMFYDSDIMCITDNILQHSEKHKCTPEQSYEKWRNALKNIVNKGEFNND